MRSADCVGCGYCCTVTQCYPALMTNGFEARCRHLKWNGERYICEQAAVWEHVLAIGQGCTSSLNDWRNDVKERPAMNENQQRAHGVYT